MTCIIIPMGTAMDAHKCESMGTAVRSRTALNSLMVSVDVKHHVYLLIYTKKIVSRFGLAVRVCRGT